jgi:hypothetical protein
VKGLFMKRLRISSCYLSGVMDLTIVGDEMKCYQLESQASFSWCACLSKSSPKCNHTRCLVVLDLGFLAHRSCDSSQHPGSDSPRLSGDCGPTIKRGCCRATMSSLDHFRTVVRAMAHQ